MAERAHIDGLPEGMSDDAYYRAMDFLLEAVDELGSAQPLINPPGPRWRHPQLH